MAALAWELAWVWGVALGSESVSPLWELGYMWGAAQGHRLPGSMPAQGPSGSTISIELAFRSSLTS